MKIGVIADDFTGATDAASFIVKHGLTTIQLAGVSNTTAPLDADAFVISLKTRSCPVDEAVQQSLEACQWLLNQGCTLIYFKYCSTFDSTEQGNIGPVTEALMAHLQTEQTLICPALPINGRTLYQGNLFVFDQLLSESGMRHHPITPMRDANILRVMESQSQGKAGLLDWQTIQQGVDACHLRIQNLAKQQAHFVVCDTLSDTDLLTIARSTLDFPLLTGGSGLVGALAAVAVESGQVTATFTTSTTTNKPNTKGIVISGSCSQMTNKQVANYQSHAPSLKVDIEQCLNNKAYIDELENWCLEQPNTPYFPMVYATVPPEELQDIQAKFGPTVAEKVEHLFHELVHRLAHQQFSTFISAGGETSGTVTQALGIEQFRIGAEIAPGVPWVSSLDNTTKLALKSGNFGDEDFFQKAQDMTS
ncbi:four-carbon acid sugar kinase family protein [Marinomonas agarivorans]|nr:four-carbon acid sugar kinase family protein [Marinomonas agarivorans]